MASHTQNVRTIRDAFKSLNTKKWEAGDAALDEVPMGKDGSNNAAGTILRRLAEEAGVESHALSEYRNVSDAWTHTTRVVGASWSAHRELRGYPNKERLLRQLVRKHGGTVTVNQVLSEVGRPASSQRKGFDELPIDEAWAEWGKRMSALLDSGARLANRSDAGAKLGAHSAIARLIYERICERQIDAEYRQLTESELSS